MDREGSMPHSALNRTAWIKALSLSLIYLVNVFYKSVLGVVGAWDAIAAKDRPQEKDVYVKYEITMSIERGPQRIKQWPSRNCLGKWNIKVYSHLIEPTSGT